jgi:hypothetical protein
VNFHTQAGGAAAAGRYASSRFFPDVLQLLQELDSYFELAEQQQSAAEAAAGGEEGAAAAVELDSVSSSSSIASSCQLHDAAACT